MCVREWIRGCKLEVSMTTLEGIVLFGFGLVCYLLWDIRQQLFFMNRNILDRDRKWVIFVINVNIHLRLYGDVNITIIKSGFLFVTTVLKKLDFLILDLLVKLKISKEW